MTTTIARNRTALVDSILYGATKIWCHYSDGTPSHVVDQAKVWGELRYNKNARLRDHGNGHYTVEGGEARYELVTRKWIPAVGDQVRFRPDFGEVGRDGTVFIVDGEKFTDNISDDKLATISLKTRIGKRWNYRLGYIRDLLPA